MQQAELLGAQYDTVVANPPYMGSKFHIPNALSEEVLPRINYKGYEK